MTGHVALLFNRQQQHIGIAVVAQATQFLDVAAGGSLMPQLLAGTAPVVHVATIQGALQGLAIHPGHHQHRPIEPVLGHGGHQTRLIPTQALDPGWSTQLKATQSKPTRLGPGRLRAAPLEAARAVSHGIAGHWVERY